jgi:hypothetical protein
VQLARLSSSASALAMCWGASRVARKSLEEHIHVDVLTVNHLFLTQCCAATALPVMSLIINNSDWERYAAVNR